MQTDEPGDSNDGLAAGNAYVNTRVKNQINITLILINMYVHTEWNHKRCALFHSPFCRKISSLGEDGVPFNCLQQFI